jgi:hypothetical protein
MHKEYPGSPVITYENPNEELGEDIIVVNEFRKLGFVIPAISLFPLPALHVHHN